MTSSTAKTVLHLEFLSSNSTWIINVMKFVKKMTRHPYCVDAGENRKEKPGAKPNIFVISVF